MAITKYHAELTLLDDVGNQNIIYPKTTISDVYTDSTSNVSITGKISYYGSCNISVTAATQKVSIPGFKLEDGVHVNIKIASIELTGTQPEESGITYDVWSLQINQLKAYPIKFRINGTDGEFLFRKNSIISLVFDATDQVFYQTNDAVRPTLSKIGSSDNGTFYLTSISSDNRDNYSYIRKSYTNEKIYIKKDTIYAPYFEGDGSHITNIEASNIKNGTISSDRLPDISGLNAATYGPSSNATLSHGGTFLVPKVQVNKKGLITSISNMTLTLPSTFEGNSATATKLQTPRTLTIGNTGKQFDGSTNVSWTLSEIGAAASSHSHSYAGSDSVGGAANSAKKLTNFIQFKIGNTIQLFNGTSDMAWTLDEIGASTIGHTHLYAGSDEAGGVANDSYSLKSEITWGSGRKNVKYYPALDNTYCGDSTTDGTPLDRIACMYVGEEVSHTGTNYTENDWLIHPVSINDILNDKGIGTHLYKEWALYNDGTSAITGTNDGYSTTFGLVLSPGAWIIVNRIWTESYCERYSWSTAVSTLAGDFVGTIGYHNYDKTVGQGAYQEIQCMDFLNNEDTVQVAMVISGYPAGYNLNHCTMSLHAMKIR